MTHRGWSYTPETELQPCRNVDFGTWEGHTSNGGPATTLDWMTELIILSKKVCWCAPAANSFTVQSVIAPVWNSFTSYGGSHKVYSGCHEKYSGSHEDYSGSHVIYSGCHEVYSGCYEVNRSTAACQGILRPVSQVSIDFCGSLSFKWNKWGMLI